MAGAVLDYQVLEEALQPQAQIMVHQAVATQQAYKAAVVVVAHQRLQQHLLWGAILLLEPLAADQEAQEPQQRITMEGPEAHLAM